MTNRNQLPGTRNATVRGDSAGVPGFRSPETNFLEETMETKHTRLGVWALLLFTCFALFGGQSAFAYDTTKMRAEGAGWVCKPGGSGPSGCEEVKIGLTAKINKGNLADGRFEYMNKTNKFNVKGRVTSLMVKPNNAAAPADPTHPCYAAAIFDPATGQQIAGPPLNAPYANITGSCDDGMCDQFVITVVDDDSTKHNDWVCNVHMHGTDKKGNTEVYIDPGQPLQHGSFEIHPEQ